MISSEGEQWGRYNLPRLIVKENETRLSFKGEVFARGDEMPLSADWDPTPQQEIPTIDLANKKNIPSGKLTKSYWQWPFIVSFPIKNGDFP